MIYIINDRAFIGPVVDMRIMIKIWMESKIGMLEEWPGQPEGFSGPWPNFNNALVESYYYRRSEWHKKAAALLDEFCNQLEGFTEEQYEEI